MKDDETYTQCEICKGPRREVSWLPTVFAQVGRLVQIKRNGVWDDGWIVIYVGQTLPAKEVLARERDYIRQREASDI